MKNVRPRCIVAIGGGDVRKRETLAIDRAIVRLTRKKRPRFLFIPTASSDSRQYAEVMSAYYGGVLGCATDTLYLLQDHPNLRAIARSIADADIIYVGGGNTLMMMRRWRHLGVDRLLRRAYERGAIMTGMSAGSICWFASGHSDSMSFYAPERWSYINVRGLGLLPWIHCPHYNSHTLRLARRTYFRRMIATIGGRGIAIDNNCAIIFRDEQYRVISSRSGAAAYVVTHSRGVVLQRRIAQRRSLAPIAELEE